MWELALRGHRNICSDGEVLHDYFATREGGGRLALTLGRRCDWPVTGGFVSPDVPFEREWPGVHLRDLGVRPGFRPRQSVSLARAWQRYRSRAKLVVYSGTYAPMAVENHLQARNILYCHTPPRFLYDQRSFYLESMSLWQRPALMALIRYLRPRYERAFKRMDRILVNSENVRRRVRYYLGYDSTVVYPPCDVRNFHWDSPEGYYLSTARLDPLKRVDLIVAAFKRMPDKRLVVISDGTERGHLETLAAGARNIEFLGAVSEQRLRDLIGRSTATIYAPREEDFGMSPVESMAAGKPVIGVAEGGLLETIVDGETGLLIPPDPDVDDMVQAVSCLTPRRAGQMRAACERRSEMFTAEVFLDRMRDILVDH